MENFDLDHIRELSLSNAKNYLTQYFIPLTDGNHAFYIDGKYEIRGNEEVSPFFKRMNKELNKFYFNEYTQLKTVKYKLNEQLVHR